MLPRILVTCLLVVTLAAADPRPQSDKPTTPETAKQSRSIGIRRAAKGIPNFGEVTPRLFRGAQPTEVGMDALKKLGIEIVVDMRRSENKAEKDALAKRGMQYITIPSRCPYPSDEPIAKFLAVVHDNPGKKIFVHCRLGDDRTGIAVASYRMAMEGWSAEEAMKEMKAFGFSPVHHAICPGLAEYEAGFPERLKKSAAFKDLQAATVPAPAPAKQGSNAPAIK